MGLKLDGIMTVGTLDSSGEILNVHGIDITDFEDGKAMINFEHEKGSEDQIGAVIYAKKIYTKGDCETDRQKMFWDMCKMPYVYIVGELFDDEDHAGAMACAAMVRFYHKRGEKMYIGWSVEGQTLERKGHILDRSVGRKVAFTCRPCNKAAVMGVFEDPKVADGVKKFEGDSHIQCYQVDTVIFEDAVLDLRLATQQLQKTLEASSGNVAPSQLTQGSALAREHIVGSKDIQNRVKAAVRDWNRQRPLRETIKAALPEIGDTYLDHFTDLAEQLSLKKGMPRLTRIGVEHSPNVHADQHQSSLVNGLYWDQSKSFKPENYVGTANPLKLKNDAGDNVFVKDSTTDLSQPPQHDSVKATNYYHLARDVFGMQNHVPATNYFDHPKTGDRYQAMKFLEGADTAYDSKKFEDAYRKAKQNGDAHKLVLMDLITGTTDRHLGNVMVGPDHTLHHIDNDYAFSFQPDNHAFINDIRTVTGAPGGGTEDLHIPGVGSEVLHPTAKAWLDKIDPKVLAQKSSQYGIHPQHIRKMVQSLVALKAMAKQGQNIHKMSDNLTEMHYNQGQGTNEQR
ncbi:MAG: hypothetical protein ACREGB_01800 [Candidatus Saccharimonadales bacterium]